MISDPGSESIRTLLTNWRGPILSKWQHYLDAYDRHFRKFRGTDATIVEIGLKDGGSLALWRQYFGERARIIGADIYGGSVAIEHDPFYGRPDRVVVGDQGTPAFWSALQRALPRGAGTADVLIDDGSHKPSHMIRSAENALALLAPGGVYVCEDVHGARNDFLVYIYSKYVYDTAIPQKGNREVQGQGQGWLGGRQTTLNAFRSSGTVRTNYVQRRIFALTLYPYLAVIETRDRPLEKLSGAVYGRRGINGSRHNWRSAEEAARTAETTVNLVS